MLTNKLEMYAQFVADSTLSSIKGDIRYYALGLCGEAGEVAEVIKKSMRRGKISTQEEIRSELVDVLWYLTALASAHEISLDALIDSSITKIITRQPHLGEHYGKDN